MVLKTYFGFSCYSEMRCKIFSISIILFLVVGCASRKYSDVSYSVDGLKKSDNQLNIFVPRSIDTTQKYPVMVFVYGGNWHSGSKGIYNSIGRNFAKKGIITFIPNYTKSPKVSYDEMTQEIATSIRWVKKNIHQYHGDTNRLYLSGHSAGGHLSALSILSPKYGIDQEKIAGLILIDAAGLDMYSYLKDNPPTKKNHYLTTWTNNADEWKKASPLYYVNKKLPPLMVYVGEKTYPSIKSSNRRFIKKVKEKDSKIEVIYLNKRHMSMITQFMRGQNKRYDEVIEFMTAVSGD